MDAHRASEVEVSAASVQAQPVDETVALLRDSIESSAWRETETIIADNLTDIAFRYVHYSACVRAIPRSLFAHHPVFALARLFIDLPDRGIPIQEVRDLVSEAQIDSLASNDHTAGEEHALGHARMLARIIFHRLAGRVREACALSSELEANCLKSSAPRDETADAVARNMNLMLWEIGYTAMLNGRADMANRVFRRLRARTAAHGDAHGAAPGAAHDGAAAARERGWQIASLEGLALTHELQGDRHTALDLVSILEQTRLDGAHESLPLSWLTGAAARSLIAGESAATTTQGEIYAQAEPWLERTELRPLLEISEISRIHQTQGIEWAVPLFQARLISTIEEWSNGSACAGAALIYQAMMLSWSGHRTAVAGLVETFPDDVGAAQVEKARLALMQGEHVRALLLAQHAGIESLMWRNQADRLVVIAIAAWGCGQRDEALAVLREAAQLIQRFEIQTVLTRVPWKPLRELVAHAQELAICDLVAEVDAIPAEIRIAEEKPLSPAERLALKAMAEHPRLADAAAALFVTPATLKRTRADIYRKLGASTRDEALLKASRRGLL